MQIVCLLVLGLVAVCSAQNDCDPAFSTIYQTCLSARNSVIEAQDTKSVCCNYSKLYLCLQTAKGYVAVAKLIKACPVTMYDTMMAQLDSPIAKVDRLCPDFNYATCVSEPISQQWTSMTKDIHPQELAEPIVKNVNLAYKQVSDFTKDIGNKISLSFGNRIDSNVPTSTKKYSDILSESNKNSYSIIDSSEGNSEIIDSVVDFEDIKTGQPSTTTTQRPKTSLQDSIFEFIKNSIARGNLSNQQQQQSQQPERASRMAPSDKNPYNN